MRKINAGKRMKEEGIWGNHEGLAHNNEQIMLVGCNIDVFAIRQTPRCYGSDEIISVHSECTLSQLLQGSPRVTNK